MSVRRNKSFLLRRLRELALAAACLLIATDVAWAAPVTDNIVPIGGFGAPFCMNDPDGGDGSVDCLTDNADVYFYMDSSGEFELEARDKNIVNSALRSEYGPTDLAITYDYSPVFSGSAETDIIYQEGSKNIDSDAIGVSWCNDSSGGDGTYSVWECDQQYVRIRGNDTIDLAVACHESGHAVGLTHGSDADPKVSNSNSVLGCMTTPSNYTTLGSSNASNINFVYDKP